MGFYNKCILLGNVTRNPEVRFIPGSGTPVARFGLAVNRTYKQGNETKEETLFIDITAFARLAEFAGEYITKGMPLMVDGRLQYRTWEQDGQKRSKHEIVAETIQLVSSRRDRDRDSGGSTGYDNSNDFGGGSDAGSGSLDEDDIPF